MGDVFLHMLPDCMQSSPEYTGLFILFGFLIFFSFDVLVRESSPHHHHHHHEHAAPHETTKSSSDPKLSNGHATKSPSSPSSQGGAKFTHTVILNLAADALHNFIDGIAIGTSYATSSHLGHGHIATLSVLLHEIPHELGDFAILVNAGFSKRQAITAQFMTAIAAFIGTVVGLTVTHGVDGGDAAMLGFTAGGFLYLAAVGILPEVLDTNSGGDGGGVGWRLRMAQIFAFCVGIAFMLGVAILEGHEEHGHHHEHGGEHKHHIHHHHDDL